jgi:3-hydroxymyristoyl/3-hydroxydecanoyl-(acyl carrier protein) dehydratase
MSARLTPQILQQTSGPMRLEYLLNISSDIVFFQGHFPGFPILPGFIQVGWAIELAKPLAPEGSFVSVRRLKFMRPITCDRKVLLTLSLSDDHTQVKFKYFNELFGFSSGRILFGF